MVSPWCVILPGLLIFFFDVTLKFKANLFNWFYSLENGAVLRLRTGQCHLCAIVDMTDECPHLEVGWTTVSALGIVWGSTGNSQCFLVNPINYSHRVLTTKYLCACNWKTEYYECCAGSIIVYVTNLLMIDIQYGLNIFNIILEKYAGILWLLLWSDLW